MYDKQFLDQIYEDAKLLGPGKIVDDKRIVWTTQLDEVRGLEPGQSVINRIWGTDGWYGVTYRKDDGSTVVGTFPNRNSARRAQQQFDSNGQTLRGRSGPEKVQQWKNVQEQRARLALNRAKNRLRRTAYLAKFNQYNNNIKWIRRVLIIFGAWTVMEDFLKDLYDLVSEIVESAQTGDFENVQDKVQVLTDYVSVEFPRVFGRILTYFIAGIIVARTARLIVSRLMWALRVGSLATGPGAILAWSLSLIIEAGAWATLSTQWGQEKMRTAFAYIMANWMPESISSFFIGAVDDVVGEDGDTDIDRGVLTRETEQTVREVIESFADISNAEIESMRDELQQRIDAEPDPVGTDRSNDRTTPAPRITRPSTPATAVTPNMSIQQQMDQLDW